MPPAFSGAGLFTGFPPRNPGGEKVWPSGLKNTQTKRPPRGTAFQFCGERRQEALGAAGFLALAAAFLRLM
jgi:hypothetical protein